MNTKPVTALVVSDEEIITRVWREMERPGTPRALNDLIIAAGVTNPFQIGSVRKAVIAELKPNGSKHHYTKEGRWLRTTERWAEELGVTKGKAELTYTPALPVVEEVRSHVSGSGLPVATKESMGTALAVLTQRANRKLDEASVQIMTESLKTVVEQSVNDREGREKAEVRAEKAEAIAEAMVALSRELARKLPDAPGNGLANLPIAAE